MAKSEPHGDNSGSSLESSPEPEMEQESLTQETPATQKRKGGRKPIYATSEERKQRNRQAQAAFRERRTEYIKQLESTIKHHEDTLQSLQQSHRSAADECLMLRYKNSLLERILIEKGIDVQAELRAKTGSPQLGPTTISPVGQNPSMQRAVMNRHNQNKARRSNFGVSKPEPTSALPLSAAQSAFSSGSPQLQPTPSSHTSSPSTHISPTFGPQGVITPPINDRLAQPPQQSLRPSQQQGRPSQQGFNGPQGGFVAPGAATNHRSTGPSSFYPPSPFASHMEQLGKLTFSLFTTPVDPVSTEQEYDDMLDDQAAETEPEHHQSSFPQPQQFHQRPPQQQGHRFSGSSGSASGQMFDPYDPALDADPFGLTASMSFPTPFSFETSSARQPQPQQQSAPQRQNTR
ncbi:MAG: hypothetical protein M1814_003317 [Vezdaea aestivalis]|nr:MAG: hypothetical protein M1814_003317 [Vezdaea aestivalis]